MKTFQDTSRAVLVLVRDHYGKGSSITATFDADKTNITGIIKGSRKKFALKQEDCAGMTINQVANLVIDNLGRIEEPVSE